MEQKIANIPPEPIDSDVYPDFFLRNFYNRSLIWDH